MPRRRNRERAQHQMQVLDGIEVGEMEPPREDGAPLRFFYRPGPNHLQPLQVGYLIPGRRNPYPRLPVWDPMTFRLNSPTNTLIDWQLYAILNKIIIPYTTESVRYMCLHSYERGADAEQTRIYLMAMMAQRDRNVESWPMEIEEIQFWFRRFRRGNEDLEKDRKIKDLMEEEAGWQALSVYYFSLNSEEIFSINWDEPKPFVQTRDGPLPNLTLTIWSRYQHYRFWLRQKRTYRNDTRNRRYGLVLAYQHHFSVNQARDFLWGMLGPPEEERYPVEREEVEFWYRRFRRGNFTELDLELRKTQEELQREEQGWLALGLLQPFDWVGCYHLSYVTGTVVKRYNQRARAKRTTLFRVVKGVLQPYEPEPIRYFDAFIDFLPARSDNERELFVRKVYLFPNLDESIRDDHPNRNTR